jgi:hypothetical protein
MQRVRLQIRASGHLPIEGTADSIPRSCGSEEIRRPIGGVERDKLRWRENGEVVGASEGTSRRKRCCRSDVSVEAWKQRSSGAQMPAVWCRERGTLAHPRTPWARLRYDHQQRHRRRQFDVDLKSANGVFSFPVFHPDNARPSLRRAPARRRNLPRPSRRTPSG